MNKIGDSELFREVSTLRSSAPPNVVWTSCARAIGILGATRTLKDPLIALSQSFIDDGSTRSLLEDLARTSETLLGVIPTEDGDELFVFSREQSEGWTPLSAVFLMSTDFAVLGIYRTEITGIFKKKLVIGALTQANAITEVKCSRLDDIRAVGSHERLITSVLNAGRLHRIFPANSVPEFCLPHWWLPLRRWLHF